MRLNIHDTYVKAKLGALHQANQRLVQDWHHKLLHLWTIRLALFWIVVSSLVGVWGALENVVPTSVYVGLGFAMNLSLGIARLLKQPGVDP